MAIDLPRVVDAVRDDLKKLYQKDPAAIWERPVVVISQDGQTSYLDSNKPDEYMAGWLAQFRGPKRIDAVVVGRMVVKQGGVLDASGEATVKEKAILVTGRSFATGRTVVTITPTKEFRDFRSPETIDKEGILPNPGVSSPDTSKAIVRPDGVAAGTMLGQFGKEQRFDSAQGQRCMMDPLIQGVLDTPDVSKVEDPAIAQAVATERALRNIHVGPYKKKGG